MNKHVIDVPQLVRAEKQDRVGDRQMTVMRLYTPPLDGTPDLHIEFDAFVEARVVEILKHHYPGYVWMCISRAQQGVVYFSIPALMGDTLVWAIRLAQWSDMCPKLVIDGGGQLLERMNLPRTGFEAASFCDARENRHKFDFSGIGKGRNR